MDGAQGGLAVPGAPWRARQPRSLEEVAARGVLRRSPGRARKTGPGVLNTAIHV